MRKVYSENGFYEESILCERCGWEGSGYDVNIVDLYGLAKIKEVHCPKCDTHLAGIERASGRTERGNERFNNDSLGHHFG